MTDPISPGKPVRLLGATLLAAFVAASVAAEPGSQVQAASGAVPATGGPGLAAPSGPRLESQRPSTAAAGSAAVRAIPVLHVPVERAALEWEMPAPPPDDCSEYGDASWYGPGFHGRTAASGETYDATARTVAHRTLPLGSIVEIENLETGRSVIARVNDRGPYVDGRIVDCSYAVAMELDFLGSGVAPVRLTVLDSIAQAADFEGLAHASVLPWEDRAPAAPEVEVEPAIVPVEPSPAASARRLAALRQANLLPFPAIVHASRHVYDWIAAHRSRFHVPAGVRTRIRDFGLRDVARLFWL